MSDSARIIMTFKCDKACPGCANTYGSVLEETMFSKVSENIFKMKA